MYTRSFLPFARKKICPKKFGRKKFAWKIFARKKICPKKFARQNLPVKNSPEKKLPKKNSPEKKSLKKICPKKIRPKKNSEKNVPEKFQKHLEKSGPVASGAIVLVCFKKEASLNWKVQDFVLQEAAVDSFNNIIDNFCVAVHSVVQLFSKWPVTAAPGQTSLISTFKHQLQKCLVASFDTRL